MQTEHIMSNVSIVRGFPASQQQQAAKIYYAAFEHKLSPILGDSTSAIDILKTCMFSDNAFIAVKDGAVLGLVGFEHAGHKLVNITALDLIRTHGLLSGLWRTALGWFLSRTPHAGELLLDGIAVHPDARGCGIGTRLLETIFDFAREHNYARIRLEVVDTNPRACQLYERIGFRPMKTSSAPFMRAWGFTAVTTMIYTIETTSQT